ncbi:MAG: hypothetical protein HUJ96_06520 [Marinilabiliaceae bacterium]|nr:hypothetical protein [Marinilabiliaceae bacterium]
MKAIDTFRTPPYMHNCAQAVANHWKVLFENTDIVSEYSPYVGGKAPEGYCGALYAAMQACQSQQEAIKTEFANIVGATHCIDIKRNAKTSCHVCVDTADELVAKYSKLLRGEE